MNSPPPHSHFTTIRYNSLSSTDLFLLLVTLRTGVDLSGSVEHSPISSKKERFDSPPAMVARFFVMRFLSSILLSGLYTNDKMLKTIQTTVAAPQIDTMNISPALNSLPNKQKEHLKFGYDIIT